MGVLGAIPDAFERLGAEVSAAWPLVILLTSIFAGFGWAVKAVQKMIRAETEPIKAQLQPNGGGSVIDILKRMELEAQKGAEAHETLTTALFTMFEAAPQAIFRTNAAGASIQVNDAYLQLWGFDDHATARSDAWMAQIDDQSVMTSRFETIFSEPFEDFSFATKLKDGRIFRIIGHPVLVNKEFTGYVGYVYDVSDLGIKDQIEKLERKIDRHIDWEMAEKWKNDHKGEKREE